MANRVITIGAESNIGSRVAALESGFVGLTDTVGTVVGSVSTVAGGLATVQSALVTVGEQLTVLENADGSRSVLQQITTAKDPALLDDADMARLPIPEALDGWTVDLVEFGLSSPSSTGAVKFRVGRWRPSTSSLLWFYGATGSITIDEGDHSSRDSAVTPSFNSAYATVAAGDYLWVDLTDYGTGAVGLHWEARFVR